jgi:retinol dehydrogenase 14
VNGQYFANSQPRKSSKSAYDTAAAGRSWQVSTDLVSLASGLVTRHDIRSARNSVL